MLSAVFLDSASLADIRYWTTMGLVDGVTTNPALLAKEGGDPLAHLASVAAVVEGPVSAQVTATSSAAMIRQGKQLADIGPNIVVKLPANENGLRAAQQLVRDGTKINVTLGFDPAQAIPFARIPVDYFSLIVGRVEDFGDTALGFINEARKILDCLESSTKLLVASVRNPIHLRAAVTGGADVVTVPPLTWSSTFAHPNSLQGLDDFARAWNTLDPAARAGYEALAQGEE